MKIRLKHQRLAQELARANISQNRWAQKLGVSRSYLSMLVNGQRRYPGAALRRRLLEGLDLSFEELFEAEELEGTAENHSTRPRVTWSQETNTRNRHRPPPGDSMFSTFVQDCRLTLRMLWRNPSFTAVTLLALALGIGANTAIFSVVNAVLLRPLPYPEPSRLLKIRLKRDDAEFGQTLSAADFLALQRESRSFNSTAAYYAKWGDFTLTGRGTSDKIPGQFVTADFFSVLQTPPLIGRTFLSQEAAPGGEPLAVVSFRFWETRLNSAADAPGQSVVLDGTPATIIGVMPADFREPDIARPAEVWLLSRFEEQRSRAPFYLQTIGRLKEGVDRRQADQDLTAVTRQIKASYPESSSNWGLVTEDLKEELARQSGPTFILLFSAVVFLLLISIANVANLLLAKATARERELAVRSALGASRRRLFSQLLTESALIAFLGGAAGLLLAVVSVRTLVVLSNQDVIRHANIQLDSRVLLFTLASSLLAGLLFGLAPIFQISRGLIRERLKEGGRGAVLGWGRGSLRSAFVVAEFALALVLLVGAGLMSRSLMRLQEVNPGFDPENLLTLRLSVPESSYAEQPQVGRLFDDLLTKARSLPGIGAAAVSMSLPPDLLVMTNPVARRDNPPPPGQEPPAMPELLISPDYFKTLGIPLVKGRFFNAQDRADSPEVMIISESMARHFFPDEDPIGKLVQTGEFHPENPGHTIVGVVGDVNYSGLGTPVEPTMYVPYEQNLWWRTMYVVLRTGANPDQLAPLVRSEIASIDPELAVTEMRSMNDLIYNSAAEPRFRTLLLSVFSAAALLLACLGIYGVMSYLVNQRTRETGVRIALGARQVDVLKLMVGYGMKLTVVGLAIGLIGAAVLSRLLASLLFSVSPMDPLTFLSVPLVLAAVSFLACYIPARRAARVDPVKALKYE